MWRVAGALVILVAVLRLYGPHLERASFVYEDHQMVEGTSRAWHWRSAISPRGVTHESWTLVRTPEAAHALNLVLHLLVVALTALVIGRVTANPSIGLSVAALMALHPLTVETVAYAVSRAELIAGVGALAALACVTARSAWPMACLPFLIGLAYAGKETGLVVVALIPLVLWMQGATGAAARVLWLLIGAGALVAAVWWPAAAALMTVGNTSNIVIGAGGWGLMQAEAVWRLCLLSVAPFWLSVNPDITAPSLAGIWALVFLAGLAEIAWRCRRTAPLVTFGLVWCALIAAPRFLVRTPLSPFNEHQWYLAMPGVGCVLMGGIDALVAWRRPELRCPA